MVNEKTIVGLTEKVKINGHEVTAKIDTGSSRSSIDMDLASKLRLGPIVKKSVVVSAHGRSVRPVIKVKLEVGGRKFNVFFNVIHRGHMRYKVLLGNNILKRRFLIDPSKGLE